MYPEFDEKRHFYKLTEGNKNEQGHGKKKKTKLCKMTEINKKRQHSF